MIIFDLSSSKLIDYKWWMSLWCPGYTDTFSNRSRFHSVAFSNRSTLDCVFKCFRFHDRFHCCVKQEVKPQRYRYVFKWKGIRVTGPEASYQQTFGIVWMSDYQISIIIITICKCNWFLARNWLWIQITSIRKEDKILSKQIHWVGENFSFLILIGCNSKFGRLI